MLERYMRALALCSLALVLTACGGQRTLGETEPIRDTESEQETESAGERKPVTEVEPERGTGLEQETESAGEREPVTEVEPIRDTGLEQETESAGGREAVTETEPVSGTVTLHETESKENRPNEDMQKYLEQATVRIQGEQCQGSGVVWSVEENVLVIVTAAHVVRDNGLLTVQFAQGDPLESRLRFISDKVDVAFLEVSLEKIEEGEIPWQAALWDREACSGLETGQELWIMGSIEEAADRTYSGSVTQPWIYLEDFENYMLLGQAYVIPGTSGGGVFTQEGILVGILCGGNDTDQIAVLPWSVMEAAYLSK